jgi:hypothetical protein
MRYQMRRVLILPEGQFWFKRMIKMRIQLFFTALTSQVPKAPSILASPLILKREPGDSFPGKSLRGSLELWARLMIR